MHAAKNKEVISSMKVSLFSSHSKILCALIKTLFDSNIHLE